MGLLEYILWVAVVTQALLTVQVLNNYRYAKKKSKRQRVSYRPSCVLIVPCKGLDETFDANIESFFNQDYQPYHLRFVVQDTADPAYSRLQDLKARFQQDSRIASADILVSGTASSCSQKLHNLLFATRQIAPDSEVLVFADSDACAGPDWLAHIVYPLGKEKTGASGGYRCFVPPQNNLATLALSAVNSKVCQLLGNTRFNLAWGGSMAIRVSTFKKLGLEKIWEKALSDDLSLSAAVRKEKLKMVFVPACMIASHETTTWPKLWEFARRQFIITRVYAPLMWLFGLLNTLWSVLTLWGSVLVAIWALCAGWQSVWMYAAPAILIVAFQASRAFFRQEIILALLPQYRDEMKVARCADRFFFWAWTILLLLIIISSAIGRTITWRNIRYRLNGPLDIQILDP